MDAVQKWRDQRVTERGGDGDAVDADWNSGVHWISGRDIANVW